MKVELADIAFAVDSILAAAAIALALPAVGGDFRCECRTIYCDAYRRLIGVIIMRFFANYFVELWQNVRHEVAAFVIVGWVGVKLSVLTLAHEAVGIIPAEFPHSTTWKIIFMAVMVIIVLVGWFAGSRKLNRQKKHNFSGYNWKDFERLYNYL